MSNEPKAELPLHPDRHLLLFAKGHYGDPTRLDVLGRVAHKAYPGEGTDQTWMIRRLSSIVGEAIMNHTSVPSKEFSDFVMYMPKVVHAAIEKGSLPIDADGVENLVVRIFIEGCLLVLATWNVSEIYSLGKPLEVY